MQRIEAKYISANLKCPSDFLLGENYDTLQKLYFQFCKYLIQAVILENSFEIFWPC